MLAWMEQGELQVKRDLDEGAGRVRIMTVHGAKGLEAPIVFLADQRRRPQALSGLFWIDVSDAQLPVWSPNKASDDPIAARARADAMQRQLEEENRLLYVALTRAEERLYLCGWRGLQTINEPSWHDHVREAAGKAQAKTEPRPASLSGAEEGWEGEVVARQRRRGDRRSGSAADGARRDRPARLARRADSRICRTRRGR